MEGISADDSGAYEPGRMTRISILHRESFLQRPRSLFIPQAREVGCCGVEYSHPQHVTCYSCPSHHFICASGCPCLGQSAVARDGSLHHHHLLASSSRVLKQIRRFVWKALTVASETSDACSPSQKDVLAAESLSDWLVASCQNRVGVASTTSLYSVSGKDEVTSSSLPHTLEDV
jgi:hypothetical protein